MADYTLDSINRNECVGNSLSTINLNFETLANNFLEFETKLQALSATTNQKISTIVPGSNVILSPVSSTGVITISAVGLPSGGISLIRDAVLSATNVGGVGARVFKQKNEKVLEFRRITSGASNVLVQEEGDVIKISAFDKSGSSGGEYNTASNEGTGQGLVLPKVGVNLPFKTLAAGSGISLTPTQNTIIIASNLAVSASNVGGGAKVFSNITNNNLTFKTILSGTPNVNVQEIGNEIKIGVFDTLSASNIGNGQGLFKEKNTTTNSLIFKSLSAGTPSQTDSSCNVVFTNTANNVFLTVSDNVTATNLGSSTTGRIFKEKSGNALRFRTITGAGQVTVATSQAGTADNIVIGLQPGTSVLSATVVGVNAGLGAGVFKEKNGPELVFRSLSAGPGITINQETDIITLSAQSFPPLNQFLLTAVNVGGGAGLADIVQNSQVQVKTLTTAQPNVQWLVNPNTVTLSISGYVTGAQNNPNASTNALAVYENQVGSTLQFKKLLAGNGILLQDSSGQIIISSTQSGGGQETPTAVTTGGSVFKNKIINGNFDIWQWQKRAFVDNSQSVATTFTSSITDSNNGLSLKFLADRIGFYAGTANSGLTVPDATFSKGRTTIEESASTGLLSATNPSP